MNQNIEHNFFVWEEKNSTDHNQNSLKNAEQDKCVTTIETKTNVENLHWKDITDPKLREKMRKKEWYQKNKNSVLIANKKQKELNKDKCKYYQQKYRELNKDEIKQYQKEYRKNNKNEIKVQQKTFYKNNKNEILDYQKNYREFHKDEIKDYQKNYRRTNKEKLKIYQKVYRETNNDKRKLSSKIWRENNRDKKRVKDKIYQQINKHKKNSYVKNRKKTDIQFKLSCNLRSRLNSAIKGNYKAGSAVKDLGCSIQELKTYLESKFQPGMTWDNWTTDGWHIDHIKPLTSFDLTDRNQLLEVCHYTNLQPLWATDNLSKGCVNYLY